MHNKSQLRKLNLNELFKHQQELREEIFKLRLQKQSKRLENLSMLQTLRRHIARTKTIAHEKIKIEKALSPVEK